MMRPIQPRALLALAVAVAATAICSVFAADTSNKLFDFLFSEDNQIAGTSEQFQSSIESKPLLRDDKWLNAPLTRLDYVLVNIQSHLKATLVDWVEEDTRKYFELPDGVALVELQARYSDETGRLFIGAIVDA